MFRNRDQKQVSVGKLQGRRISKWLLSILPVLVLFGLASSAIRSQHALAHTITVSVTSAPKPTRSLYMHTVDPTKCFNAGTTQGHLSMNNPPNYYWWEYNPANAWPLNGLIILDFGRPAYANQTYQTLLVQTTQYAIPAQIIQCTEQFIEGFWRATPSASYNPPTLRVLIGTNNLYLSSTSSSVNNKTDAYGHGNMWAGLTNKVSDWVVSTGKQAQFTVGAAIDIEPAWSLHTGAGGGGSGSGNTKGVDWWLSGYNSRAQHTLYNYGSADGCPPFNGGAGDLCAAAPYDPYVYPSGYSSDWHQTDMFWASTGAPWTRAFPEIYITDQSKQWQQISLNGYVYHNHTNLSFWGSLTEQNDCGSCSLEWKYGWQSLQSTLYNNDPVPTHAAGCTSPPICHRTDTPVRYTSDIGHLWP
jgi:hypothetical protein